MTYNIEADTNGNTAPNDGLYTVLEAIGEQSFNGVLRPIDILALQETTSNTATVAPIVTALNGYYGDGTYAMATIQGTEYNNNPTTGNGPNALIYNTKTVQLVSQAGVPGTPGKSGSYIVNRQVLRYGFQAVGAAPGTYFYLYVSHMKSSASGTVTVYQGDRNLEAQDIRADVANLPAGTGAIYVGDFNLDGSTEPAYQTLTATGTGAGVDPLNVIADGTPDDTQTWNTATYKGIMTESAVAINYRDDIQFVTADIYQRTAAAALRYVPGSLRAFGNNGTTALRKSVNLTTNTALNNLVGPITASQALAALTTGSDHLPVVADYMVATPYNTWQIRHFTSTELADPMISGDLADPDGDGIANLMEFALNLDPRQTKTLGLPMVGQIAIQGSSYLTLTYTQLKTATGITYLPQVSGDLGTWNGGTGYTVAVSTTANADGQTQTVVVRDAVPLSAANKRFARLLVSRP